MARRGKFGQAPRPAPSLGATIVSIAREMDAQEAQNVMDAWQKGGSVDGKKVTDEAVIAFWQGRLKDVSKDDPLYDTYKNTILQYQYAIGESKARTAYATGSASASQTAAFYTNWSHKVPKDSEFYRVLQRDAAQFISRAKSESASKLKLAQEQAYQDANAQTDKTHSRVGNYLSNVLTDYMMTTGNGIGVGGNVSDFATDDPATLLKFIDSLNGTTSAVEPKFGKGQTGATAPSTVSFRDPMTGKMVTAADILKTVNSMDPHFSGQLSVGYFQQALQNIQNGLQIKIDRANKTGHLSDANAFSKQRSNAIEFAREAKAWPAIKQYSDLRDHWLATWNSATATPEEKITAWNDYSGGLKRIVDSNPGLDDNTAHRILGEATGDTSMPTLAEDTFGFGKPNLQTTSGPNSGDTADTQAALTAYQAGAAAVASGAAFNTYGTWKGAEFTPGKGTQIGPGDGTHFANMHDPEVIYVPRPDGKLMPMVYDVKPIIAQVVDSQTGNTLHPDTTNDATVGEYVDTTAGRLYKYTRPDGSVKWTPASPYGDKSVKTGSDGELIVTIPIDTANADTNPNLTAHYASTSGDVTYSYKSGSALAVDPARVASGPDPALDYNSPTLAIAVSSPDAMAAYRNSKDDPMLQQSITEETVKNTGGLDANGQPVNAPAFAAAQLQNTALTSAVTGSQAKSLTDIVSNLQHLWDRETTNPAMVVSVQQTPGKPAAYRGGFGPSESSAAQPPVVTKLPSDSTVGTAFQALGDIFQTGANLFLHPLPGAAAGSVIQSPKSLTVPGVPAGKFGMPGQLPPAAPAASTPPAGTPGSSLAPIGPSPTDQNRPNRGGNAARGV